MFASNLYQGQAGSFKKGKKKGKDIRRGERMNKRWQDRKKYLDQEAMKVKDFKNVRWEFFLNLKILTKKIQRREKEGENERKGMS